MFLHREAINVLLKVPTLGIVIKRSRLTILANNSSYTSVSLNYALKLVQRLRYAIKNEVLGRHFKDCRIFKLPSNSQQYLLTLLINLGGGYLCFFLGKE